MIDPTKWKLDGSGLGELSHSIPDLHHGDKPGEATNVVEHNFFHFPFEDEAKEAIKRDGVKHFAFFLFDSSSDMEHSPLWMEARKLAPDFKGRCAFATVDIDIQQGVYEQLVGSRMSDFRAHKHSMPKLVVTTTAGSRTSHIHPGMLDAAAIGPFVDWAVQWEEGDKGLDLTHDMPELGWDEEHDHVLRLSDETVFATTLERAKPVDSPTTVVLKVYGHWSTPSKRFARVFQRVAEHYYAQAAGDVVLTKTDSKVPLPGIKVTKFPTVLLFSRGRFIHYDGGLEDPKEMIQFIDQVHASRPGDPVTWGRPATKDEL